MKRIIVRRGPARMPREGLHAPGAGAEKGADASSAYERMFAGALLCLEETAYLDLLLSGEGASGLGDAPRPRKAGG